MLWLSLPVYAATPMAGVELAPLSRADVVVVDDSQTTGRGVGESDGTVWPNLRAFAGAWVSQRFGLSGGLGVASVTATTWADDVWLSRSVGVIRPGIDGRVSLLKRDDPRPRPLLLLGVHGDIPMARIASSGFTDAEADLAQEDARVERARLGGYGLRMGAGVDYSVNDHVVVGFIWTAGWHRSTYRDVDQTAVSSQIRSEAALTLSFEWGTKSAAEPEAP